VPGPYDGMSFFIGEVNLVIIGIALIFILFKFSKLTNILKKIVIWSLVLIFSSVVMMNFRSTWLWERIPLIAYFQFPWRFLTLITFSSSLLVVVISKIKYSKVLAVLIIILSLAINYNRFRPHDFLARDDSYFINRYIPVPAPSSEYMTLEEEYLRLPKATMVRPKQVYPRVYPIDGIKNLNLENSLDAKFVTENNKSTIFNYNKYFFPGWQGIIDGKKITLSAGEPYGQIEFTVPKGKHDIVIQYRETTTKRILDYLSLMTIVGCVFVGIRKKVV